jgi:hypothetical protein
MLTDVDFGNVHLPTPCSYRFVKWTLPFGATKLMLKISTAIFQEVYTLEKKTAVF